MLTEREVYGRGRRAGTGCAIALPQVLQPSDRDRYQPFVHVPKFSVGPELSTRSAKP
jgi:hypothetical protein